MIAACGLLAGSAAAWWGLGLLGGGAVEAAVAGFLAAGTAGSGEALAGPAGESVTPLGAVASPGAACELTVAAPVTGFVPGVPEAELPEAELPEAGLAEAGFAEAGFAEFGLAVAGSPVAGSVAGCAAAVAGGLVLPGTGALEIGGVVELVSVASGVCAAAGLLLLEPSPANP